MAGGYAKEVERKTRLLLTLCEEFYFYNMNLGVSSWTWVPEKVRARLNAVLVSLTPLSAACATDERVRLRALRRRRCRGSACIRHPEYQTAEGHARVEGGDGQHCARASAGGVCSKGAARPGHGPYH